MRRKPAIILAALSVLALAAGPVPPEKGVPHPSPRLSVAGPETERAAYWSEGFEAVYRELLGNLRMPARPFATRYAQPGPAWPDTVYLWDTAFVAEVWRLWDVETGKEITRAVLDHADRGRLSHALSARERTADSQPPVMAWAVWRLYRQSGDREYLAYAYPILRDFNRWLYAERRLDSGLFHWAHPFESGMDNSPRFASRDVSRTADMDQFAAIDLSSYMVLQNHTLAAMASELGRPDEARGFRLKADELKNLINNSLWDEKTGLYYDYDFSRFERVKIKTVASLIPLFCGVPDAGRAARLRDHIMDPKEFFTPFPLPSVARDDPAFELDMWRGPVWINADYMVILGLEDYGFRDEAARLAERVADGVYRHYRRDGAFWEYYDPDKDGVDDLTRKSDFLRKLRRIDRPKDHFVGWNGLVNNLVIERLLGVGLPPGGKGEVSAAPRLPETLRGWTFEATFSSPPVRVKVETKEGKAAGEVLNNN